MLGIHVARTSKVLESKRDDAAKRTRKSMYAALKEDIETLRLTAAQIYVCGPRNSRVNRMDYERIGKYVNDNVIALAVHSSYLTVGLWSIDSENISAKDKSAIAHLDTQLALCQKLNACGLVVHLPKKPIEVVVQTLQCDAVRDVIATHKVPIILEMVPVKKGADVDTAYVTPVQVNALVANLAFFDDDLWGICVDTAHMWGAGVSPDMEEWLAAIERPQMIKLFHLNGAQENTWNSGRDVHHIALSDEDHLFGGEKKDGIVPIVQFCRMHKVPIICEINRGSERAARDSLRRIRKI
jgi:endonuclease IV